jgi:hypothetical protein
MSNNELTSIEPRLGWLVDGNPNTEHVAVLLRDTGAAIELTIPLKEMHGEGNPYSRWWSTGILFMDDPDRTKHSYKPPRVLLMSDDYGAVALVGCRAAGYRSSFAVGRGRIVANYAVLGGESLRYEAVHGIRTEIPALAVWTRLSGMEVSVKWDSEHRAESVRMTLMSPPAISLSRRMNLTMQLTWRTERPSGRFVAIEGIKLETKVTKARDWDEHLHVHGAMLDLVSIASWNAFGFSVVEVQRADARSATAWLKVVTHRLPKHEEWDKEPRFLFPYDEVGPRGIKRWLDLRRDYGRVVGPLLNILRSDKPWSHTSLVQSGIALEMLGYLVDTIKNNGANLNSRSQMSFKVGLQVILDDMETKPFSDTVGWIDRAWESYMGSKHPDRAEPDSLDMLNALRENLLVLRFWVALQLGVKAKTLDENVSMEPHSHEFVAAV